MSQSDEHEDLHDLPTAGSEDEARRAKAELWKKIAEQHRGDGGAEAPPPEPRSSSKIDKAELFRRIAEQHRAASDESPAEPAAPRDAPPAEMPAPKKSAAPASAHAGQDGRAMWEAFLKESGTEAPGEPESRRESGSPPKEHLKKSTPSVRLGGSDETGTESKDEEEHGPDEDGKGETPADKDSGELPEEPADNKQILANARKRAWIVAGAFHLLVILVMAIVHVVPVEPKLGEITAIAAAEEMETPSWKKVTTAMPQAAALQPSIAPIMAQATSNFAMPQVDMSPTASELNVGTSMGTFGTGVSKGGFGNVSFMGNQATGQYIVFVVDVSGSMSATSRVGNSTPISRFELMKRELSKSLSQIGGGTKYQVLYFSDFAWPHNEVDSNDYTQLNQYAWVIKPNDRTFEPPRFQYLVASAPTLRKSREIIKDSNNPGGTNWGSGLMMALRANPRPDVIFFMTDGSGGDAEKWVDVVTRENGRGKRSVIHTTAMMEPDTAEPLADLARRNGGKFTVVLANGAVIKGEDYFSGRRD